jgi:hypothetical protein
MPVWLNGPVSDENDGDDDQQLWRQEAGNGQARDKHHRRHRDDVVQTDQPNAAVPIEQCAGERTDQQAGQDRQGGDDAGQRGRVELLEREQHQRNARHRLGDARELHRKDDLAQVGDGEKRAI